MLKQKALPRLILSVMASFTSGNALAVTAQDQGLAIAIAIAAKKQDTGWTDFTADMKILLRNKQGQESLRQLKIKTLEIQNDGDKSLALFSKSKDVKETAFLSFSHPIASDDQWLNLPA